MCSTRKFPPESKIVEGWHLIHFTPSHSFLCLESGGTGHFGLSPVTSCSGGAGDAPGMRESRLSAAVHGADDRDGLGLMRNRDKGGLTGVAFEGALLS